MTQVSVPSLWGVILPGPPDSLEGSGRRRASDSPVRGTILCRTVERASRLMPHARVVVVSTRGSENASPTAQELAGAQHVVQPAARGTAAETFLALLKIARQDADAIVVVLPGQQGVEERFLEPIGTAVRAVSRRPDLVVMIGVRALSPGSYGWIEPGGAVDGLEDLSVRHVRRFVAEPGIDAAEALDRQRTLVSTCALVGSVRTLIAHGRRHVPDVLETLEPVEEVFGRPEEALLCDAVYEAMPHASLGTVLEWGEPLAVLTVPDQLAALPMPIAA